MTTEKGITICFRATGKMNTDLEAMAKSAGRNKSNLIVFLLNEAIEANKKQKK